MEDLLDDLSAEQLRALLCYLWARRYVVTRAGVKGYRRRYLGLSA